MSAAAELRLSQRSRFTGGSTRRLIEAVLATRDDEAIEALDAWIEGESDDE